MARKPYTGVSPFVTTTRGLVMCEPHQADYWVPVIKGKPVTVGGRALRYSTKREAEASLYTALKRREGPTRSYKLGKRMEPRT